MPQTKNNNATQRTHRWKTKRLRKKKFNHNIVLRIIILIQLRSADICSSWPNTRVSLARKNEINRSKHAHQTLERSNHSNSFSLATRSPYENSATQTTTRRICLLDISHHRSPRMLYLLQTWKSSRWILSRRTEKRRAKTVLERSNTLTHRLLVRTISYEASRTALGRKRARRTSRLPFWSISRSIDRTLLLLRRSLDAK